MNKNVIPPLFSRVNLIYLASLLILIFGILFVTGNLTAGPRMVDENQIFKLQIEFDEFGFFETLNRELVSRFGMNRMFPAYCIQKVLLAKIFGTNLFFWSFYNGLISILSGLFLFHAGRLLNFNYIASILLSLVTILGEHSVIWWRIMHGEGIGLLLLSSGLIVLLIGYRKNNKQMELSSVILFLLSALSKESFILILPAIGLFRMVLPVFYGKPFKLLESLKQNLYFLLAISLAFLGPILAIKLIIKKTSFHYTGWMGFDMEKFITIIQQYIEINNILFLILIPIIFFIFLKVQRKKLLLKRQIIINRVIAATVLFLAITIPQLLLYMSSGYFANDREADFLRYLIPCILGLSFFLATILDTTAKSTNVKYYYLLFALIVTLHLLEKFRDTYESASVYGERTIAITEWFESISDHVPKNSNIAVVFLNGYPNGYSLQASLRVYYILKEGYGYDNIYFNHYPQKPTMAQQRPAILQDDTRYHAQKMKHTNEIKFKQDLGGLMFLNWGEIRGNRQIVGTEMERYFILENKGWFDPSKYRRVSNRRGHVSYYKNN